MLSIIALIPGMVAVIVGLIRGPHTAYLMVYLPSMLLLPEYYQWPDIRSGGLCRHRRQLFRAGRAWVSLPPHGSAGLWPRLGDQRL